MLVIKLLIFLAFIDMSTASLDIKKLAANGNSNAMYALGNKLCNSPSDWEQCKLGIPYLWTAHIKNHPNALGQLIHHSINYFKELNPAQRKKLYSLIQWMSPPQKTEFAQKLLLMEPEKAKNLIVEAAHNSDLSAQWIYVKFSLTHKDWPLNKQLIIVFLNNLKSYDNLSRLLLAEMYAEGFLVEKNSTQFRSLASSVWRKLLDKPEERGELTRKAKYFIKRGQQKYVRTRKINGPK